MNPKCLNCREPSPYVVSVASPIDGVNRLYCPPCAGELPDAEVNEQTVNARFFRRAVAGGGRRER